MRHQHVAADTAKLLFHQHEEEYIAILLMMFWAFLAFGSFSIVLNGPV